MKYQRVFTENLCLKENEERILLSPVICQNQHRTPDFHVRKIYVVFFSLAQQLRWVKHF